MNTTAWGFYNLKQQNEVNTHFKQPLADRFFIQPSMLTRRATGTHLLYDTPTQFHYVEPKRWLGQAFSFMCTSCKENLQVININVISYLNDLHTPPLLNSKDCQRIKISVRPKPFSHVVIFIITCLQIDVRKKETAL